MAGGGPAPAEEDLKSIADFDRFLGDLTSYLNSNDYLRAFLGDSLRRADALPAAWGVEEARYGFPDADLGPQAIERAVALARHAHRRWRDGARVLIRCQAGVNRSGLVMALTLMNHGLAADDAIALIRRRRGTAVLSNRHFERWLLTEAAQVVGGPSSNERTAA